MNSNDCKNHSLSLPHYLCNRWHIPRLFFNTKKKEIILWLLFSQTYCHLVQWVPVILCLLIRSTGFLFPLAREDNEMTELTQFLTASHKRLLIWLSQAHTHVQRHLMNPSNAPVVFFAVQKLVFFQERGTSLRTEWVQHTILASGIIQRLQSQYICFSHSPLVDARLLSRDTEGEKRRGCYAFKFIVIKFKEHRVFSSVFPFRTGQRANSTETL